MAYARIDEGFWTDPKIKPLPLEIKLTAAWLFTNPHRHFSGIYYLPKVLIADEIGVSIEVSNESLKILEKQGFIKYSAEFSVVWVIKMLLHQSGGVVNEKQAKGIANQLKTLHGCPLIRLFLEYYKQFNIPFNTPIHTPMDTKSKSKSKSKEREAAAHSFSPNSLGKLWNEMMPQAFARVILPLANGRQNRFRVVLQKHPEKDWWIDLFTRVAGIPGLAGNNDKGWRADLDFVVKCWTNILEGKYDNWGINQEKSGLCLHDLRPAECPICKDHLKKRPQAGAP